MPQASGAPLSERCPDRPGDRCFGHGSSLSGSAGRRNCRRRVHNSGAAQHACSTRASVMRRRAVSRPDSPGVPVDGPRSPSGHQYSSLNSPRRWGLIVSTGAHAPTASACRAGAQFGDAVDSGHEPGSSEASPAGEDPCRDEPQKGQPFRRRAVGPVVAPRRPGFAIVVACLSWRSSAAGATPLNAAHRDLRSFLATTTVVPSGGRRASATPWSVSWSSCWPPV
jgi:hypothetical protein